MSMNNVDTVDTAVAKTDKPEDTLHILVVEDDLIDRTQIERLLHRSKITYRTITTEYLDRALDILKNNKFDVVLLDLNLPDSRGLETLSKLISSKPGAAIIVTTGEGADEMGLKAVSMGAHDYLIKGEFDTSSLTKAVYYSIERRKAEEDREKMHHHRQGINSLQQSLLKAVSLEEKFKKVTEDIVKLFDADFCRIWLIKKGDLCENGCVHAEVKEGPHICKYRDKCLHLVASSGRYTHIDGKVHRRVPFGCYKIGLIASSGDHKFLTNDAQNDSRVHNHDWAKEFGLVSFAGYQLHIEDGQPFGVMAIFSKHPINPAEDIVLEGICSAVSLAVQQEILSKRLQDSEEKHRVLFESSHDAIMTIEPPSWKFTSCNPATLKLFDVETQEKFLALGPWDLSPEQQPDGASSEQKSREMIEKAIKEGSNFFEWTHKRYKDGYFHATVLLTKLERGGKVSVQATVRDVTAQKQVEAALKQSEARYRSYIEATDQIAWVTNPQGQIEEDLPSWRKFTGQTYEQIKGFGWANAIHQDDVERTLQVWNTAVNSKSPYETEYRMCRHDGVYRNLLARGYPITDNNGNVKEWVGTCIDFTERKQAVDALKQSENMLSSIFTAAPVGIIISKNRVMHKLNSSMCKICGYTEQELVGQSTKMLYHAVDEYEQVGKEIYPELDKNGFKSTETIWRRKDGKVINVSLRLSILDKNNREAGEIVTVLDITEHKHAEAALKRSEARYRSFIEVTDQVAWVTNTKGEVEEDLPAWRKFTGQTYEQIKGFGWANAIHPGDVERTLQVWNTAINSKSPYEAEYRMRRHDGVYRNLLARGYPITENNGNVKEWVGTCIDITERKQAEEETIRNENRQRALLELSQKSDLSISEICNYAMEEAIKLTDSTIGYIAFVNTDETSLTMQYWSKTSMEQCAIIDKPIVYPLKDTGLWGEAVRRRQPVITNDYAAQNPAKKGVPEWHVKITRHMNIPVFDGQKIAAVAGVGNKATNYDQNDVAQLTLMMEGMWRIIRRKQMEEAVQRERSKAKKYLDIAGVMILVLDNGNIIHRINNKGCEILGYSEEELVGKNWCENFVPAEYREEVKGILGALMNGQTNKYEYHENPVITKSGQQRLIAWHNVVLWNDAKKIHAVLSSGDDITERKAAEIKLLTTYKELEKAHSDMKNMQSQIVQNEKLASIGQLAAGVAHEMNTPVGFVASNFETLEKYLSKFKTLINMYSKMGGEISTADKEQLIAKYEEIKKAAKDLKIDFILEDIDALFKESKEGLTRVTTIIQNLRDFSRIDQAEAFDEFDVNKGVESTLAVARNAIKYHSNVITEFANIPHVPCNASQINQVFLNIIVNAAQAIESQHRQEMGTIRIKTFADDQHVICQIEDDGPGIPQEYIDRVFDPFFTTKPAGKGTGLGLAVSRDIIVNKHKGELVVESVVGKGAKFVIKLPLKAVKPQKENNAGSGELETNVADSIVLH